VFLKRAISQKRSRRNGEKRGDIEHANDGNDDDSDEEEYLIVLRANYNTMKSEIKCAYRINFIKPDNIGSLLGFVDAYIATAKRARIGHAD